MTITYRIAARMSSPFYSQRVLPCRPHRLQVGRSIFVRFKHRLTNDFQVVHDSLRANLRYDDQVNVSGPHVGCQQIPSALPGSAPVMPAAPLRDGFRLTHPALVHVLAFSRHPLRIRLQQAASKMPIVAIDGSRFVTMQVAAVASKSDEIGTGVFMASFQTLPGGRGSFECLYTWTTRLASTLINHHFN